MRECTFWSGGHNWVVTSIFEDGRTHEECSKCPKERFHKLPAWQREGLGRHLKLDAPEIFWVKLACGAEYELPFDYDISGGGHLSCRVHGDMAEIVSVRRMG